jgi:hypothetical protein
VAYMRTVIKPADPDQGVTGHYSDQDVVMVLEVAVQRLLIAESAVREATANLNRLVTSAHADGQTAQATAALRSLADRRTS